MPITDLVNPAYVRDTLLASVIPLATRSGATISDAAIWAAIDEAVNTLENDYGLALRQMRFTVAEDRTRITQISDELYQMQTTLKRPLQSVQKLAVMLGNFEWYTLPIQWLWIASKAQGVLQIIPTAQGTAQVTSATYKAAYYSIITRMGYVPGVYSTTYTAGFETELPGVHTTTDASPVVVVTGLDADYDLRTVLLAGAHIEINGVMHRVKRVKAAEYTVTEPIVDDFAGDAVLYDYDPIILQYVAYSAAIPILATLGAAVYGAGVVGTSLRLDGLAQSKNLNPRGPFANLIDSYKERRDEAYLAIVAKYAPLNMTVI